MTNFFSTLRYSIGNEDWTTEEEALDIQSDDSVLCITASGDRPLNLLSRGCKKMVCVDANPAQNHLLELKAAAMKSLSYEDYIAFLGAIKGKNRERTLQLLLQELDAKAAQFWRENEKMVKRGILYQGAVERLTTMVAKFFAVARGSKVKRLFAMNDLEEQRQFVRHEWDSLFWRKFFNVLLNPFIIRFIIKDPGLANVGTNIKPGAYIWERIQSILERELARQNPLLSLILMGKIYPEAFSPYLTEAGTQIIKPRLPLLEIHTTDLLEYLESLPGPTFDAFSLSDVASYMSHANFVRLLKNVIRTANPCARFCMRQFLSSYEIPSNLKPFFIREHGLEKRLEHRESCFIYRFMVGTIRKGTAHPRPCLHKKKHRLVHI